MSEQGLSHLLDTVWTHLSCGVADRHHPARHPTLATIGPAGPELRTLVMRAVDREAETLEMQTDRLSPKAAQIDADPRVALHVWIPEVQLQIRMRAQAKLLQGDVALFDALPEQAQANYGGPPPGSPLSDNQVETNGDPARFTRVLCQLEEIDALVLNGPHQRALFTAKDGWRGTWIAP